jgi:hypothetical protein
MRGAHVHVGLDYDFGYRMTNAARFAFRWLDDFGYRPWDGEAGIVRLA